MEGRRYILEEAAGRVGRAGARLDCRGEGKKCYRGCREGVEVEAVAQLVHVVMTILR